MYKFVGGFFFLGGGGVVVAVERVISVAYCAYQI